MDKTVAVSAIIIVGLFGVWVGTLLNGECVDADCHETEVVEVVETPVVVETSIPTPTPIPTSTPEPICRHTHNDETIEYSHYGKKHIKGNPKPVFPDRYDAVWCGHE